MAFNRELSQFGSYLELDAAGKYIGITPAESSTNVGIGVTNPDSKLSVVGDANITGVVTATQFYGNLDYSYILNATAGVRTEFSVVDNGGDGSLSYDSQTGIISYVGPSSAEARAHFSATSSDLGSLSYDSDTGVFAYSGVTTANIRDQFSASSADIGSLAYDSATGQFSLSGVTTSAIRDQFSASSADIGTLTYDSATGGFSLAGVTTEVIRNQFSASSADIGTLTYDSATGGFSLAGVTTSAIRDQFSAGTGVAISNGEVSIGQPVGTSDGVTFASVNSTGIVTATGGFVGDVTGNADTATALETARDFSASGDATAPGVSFDGTGNVDLVLTLADSGVVSGSYGSSSEIPTFTVDSKGRLTAAGTTSVGTDLTVAGDSGSETIQLLSETLTIAGGTNLTSSAAADTVTINLDDDISLDNINATGVVTATSFATGTEGSAIIINSETITGPSSITLDPAGVGDNTGTVYILGDLQVEGTQTIINSTSVSVDDLNIMLADGAANDAAANGSGFTVQSGDGNKTFQFEATGDNFGSSENVNLASGKVYKINNTEVLSPDTLGSGVVNSSLTSVGTLGKLDVGNVNSTGIVTATGGFVGDVTGNADTATALETARDFSASGDATAPGVSFDGTGNVDLVLTLADSGVVSGSYGSSSEIPTFTVDSKGRLTAAGTTSVGTDLTVAGDSGSETIQLLSETLTIAGGTNLTSSAAADTVTINLDDNISLVNVNASGVITATSGFVGDLTGNADTATALETARDFSASGDASASAVSFDGTGNVDLALTLADTGVAAGSYGSATAIPTFTVDSKGRLTVAGETVVSTGMTVAGDSGSETIDLLTETLTIAGGTNLTSSAASDTVTINLDENISLTNITASGVVTATSGFIGDVTGNVTGDLTGEVNAAAFDTNANGVVVTGIATATSGFSGNLTGDVTGNADTATALETARTIELTGDVVGSVSFDGTANVSIAATIQPNSVALGDDTTGNYVATVADSGSSDISVSNSGTENAAVTLGLTDTGVASGSYGSGSEIPTFTVDSRGRLTAAGTVAVSTGMTVAGDTGSETINLLSETLTIAGGTNLTSSAASDTVTINLDENISLTSVNASGVITATSGFVGDVTGNVTGDLTGNADTATALETSRDFSASGDATAPGVSFDGTGNVDLVLTLADTGVSSGTYGSSSAIPTFTVDSKGRLTAAGTTSVGTDLTVAGDSGSETIALLTDTLTIAGGTNLTSSAAADTVTINLDNDINLDNINASGIITATSFATGAEGTGIIVNQATITGPSSITLDPSGIGDVTGTVYILGDLQVDGTQTIINSTSVSVDDLNILLADGAINDAAANGSGFTVQSGDGNKTFQFEATGDNFGSSENVNLASGKVYKINNTEVLSSDTLGSGVVNSSLTSVGTLGELVVSGVTTSSGGFSGNLTGNVTGDLTGDVTGNVTGDVTGDVTGNLTGEVNAAAFDTNANGVVVTGVATATSGFSGNLTGDVTGNADTATALETARDFSISGDATASAISFDGTANVGLALTLSDTGVAAGSYGSATAIPTFTVDSKGRLTVAGEVVVSTGMTVAGDSGTETIDLLTETLTIAGGTNLTSSAAADTVTINLDDNISLVNVNASGIVTATSGFIGDVTGNVTGDVTGNVTGNVTGDLTGNVYASSGISTFNDLYIAGTLTDVNSGVGSDGQILISVGTGVSWRNLVDELPEARTTQSFTATAGQTAFSFNYNVGYLDVYVNGVRLTSAEYTATNGTDITLSEAAFSGDNVEFVSYSTVATGSGSVNSLNDLSDVTLSGSSSGNILSYDGSGWVNTSTLSGITALDATTTATIESAVAAAPNDFSTLNISGLSTFSSNVDINAGLDVSGLTELDNVNVSGAATFASLTINGNIGIAGSIIPDVDNIYDLGSPTKMWRDVYIGPGSLYINGQKVIEENSSNIVVTADPDQNLVLQTSGSGDLELDPTGSGVIQVKGTLQIQDGTNITNSAGNNISFGNTIAVDSLTSRSDNTSLTLSGKGTGSVVVSDTLVVNGNLDVNGVAEFDGIQLSGITTSTAFHTGAEGSAIRISTNSIVGPSTITIDPANVGDNSGTVVIKGNLQIDGTTTTVNSTTVTVDDKNIVLASGAANDAAADGGGITIESGDGDKTWNWVNSTDSWTSSENIDTVLGKVYKVNGTEVLSGSTLGSGIVNSSLTSVGTLGKLDVGNINSTGIVTATTFNGDLTGNVTGNADTATALETARSIALSGDVSGSANFDGSANVTITATVADDSHNHVISNVDGLQTALDGKLSTSGTAATATKLATARTIGGVSFDGSANINLPGVNTAGNQNTSGNAATATTLATARTINGVSFNGSANITVEPYIEDDAGTNATRYLVFTDNSTAGYKRLNEDADLSYNPSSNTLSAGNFNSTSDINLKKDIEVIANPNDILNEINGVRFTWKSNDEKTVGVIAQDVEKVLPELVATNEEGTKSVSYNGLIGLLIEAVKEQGSQIAALKAEIAELKK